MHEMCCVWDIGPMHETNRSNMDLIHLSRQGDQEAVRTLIIRIRDPLLKRIRLMMGEKVRRMADSQDFLQQVILDFLESTKPLNTLSEKDLLRWLTAAARNNIRDADRRRRVRAFDALSASFAFHEIKTETPSPSNQVALNENILILLEGLEKLKDSYQYVIEMHHLEELSLKEVAVRMGRSYEAVKKLHTRAMVQLGVQLSQKN